MEPFEDVQIVEKNFEEVKKPEAAATSEVQKQFLPEQVDDELKQVFAAATIAQAVAQITEEEEKKIDEEPKSILKKPSVIDEQQDFEENKEEPKCRPNFPLVVKSNRAQPNE